MLTNLQTLMHQPFMVVLISGKGVWTRNGSQDLKFFRSLMTVLFEESTLACWLLPCTTMLLSSAMF